MMNKEEYKRELIRMWDMQRGDEYKGKTFAMAFFVKIALSLKSITMEEMGVWNL